MATTGQINIGSSPTRRTAASIVGRFAGLIEFDPHECEVAHVADGPRAAFSS